MQQRRNGCPICGRPVVHAHRPFCSERCRMVDLDRWLDGSYRLPGEERPTGGEVVAFNGRDEGDQ